MGNIGINKNRVPKIFETQIFGVENKADENDIIEHFCKICTKIKFYLTPETY